jgi:hypothetical protein
MKTPNCSVPWRFTGFDGHPDPNKRDEAWNLLKFLSRLTPDPWFCIRDFNEVLSPSEKWGGRGRPNQKMRKFQTTLEQCELSDLGYRGPKFTWSNCREGSEFIKERLDRGTANLSWCNIYPEAEIFVEASSTFDHAVLEVWLHGRPKRTIRTRGFRFEAQWVLEQGCNDVITRVWNQTNMSIQQGDYWSTVKQKMSNCRCGVEEWKKKEIGSQKKSISSLRRELNIALGSTMDRPIWMRFLYRKSSI